MRVDMFFVLARVMVHFCFLAACICVLESWQVPEVHRHVAWAVLAFFMQGSRHFACRLASIMIPYLAPLLVLPCIRRAESGDTSLQNLCPCLPSYSHGVLALSSELEPGCGHAAPPCLLVFFLVLPPENVSAISGQLLLQNCVVRFFS